MPLKRGPNPLIFRQRTPYLKRLFWAYFLLLIFEGALRKWVAPQLSAPLLVIRDPIAIFIIMEAMGKNKWPARWSAVIGLLTAGMLGLCVIQIVTVGNPFLAALYGLRSYLLPFPVAFIMGENLDAEDLRKFGICMLWLLLPLTALEVAQYIAPFTSFLNAGATQGGSQIVYVGGHARASGTFSFVVGPTDFNAMVAAFIIYGLSNEGFAKRWLLWAASLALLLSIPVIGSRTLVYELIAVVGCAGIAALSGVTQFAKSLKIVVPALAVTFLVSLLPVFSEASLSMKDRFAQSKSAEGSATHALERRTFMPAWEKIASTDYSENPFGIGMGQGAGAITTLLQGRALFVAGEQEYERAMNELGAIPGLAFMVFRLILIVMIGAAAIARARGDSEPLALLFFPSVVSTLLMGVLEQPTEQGFMVVSLAFSLTALRKKTALSFARVPASPDTKRPVPYNQRRQKRANES